MPPDPTTVAEWATRCWKEHGPTTMPFERLCIECAEQYARQQVAAFRERAAQVVDARGKDHARSRFEAMSWIATAIRALEVNSA